MYSVMFKKGVAVLYQVFKPNKTSDASYFEQLRNHSTKSVSLTSLKKGLNCERKILALKKTSWAYYYSSYKEF